MRRFFSREFLGILIPAILIGAAAIWAAGKFVDPAPPRSFVISAASSISPYYKLALKFKEQIERETNGGLRLEVRESQGSFDNLSALRDPNSGVQAGIVQGGLANGFDAPDLYSMGRLLTEPVWIFYRGDKLDHITQLKGKRLLIGPKGSGTGFLSRRLLDANGVTEENSTLITMELPAYIDAFTNGSADAGFLVLGAEATTIQKLLRLPGINLMNMAQADALIQRYPYLSALTLRQGVIDFSRNIPPVDTALVATRAMLLVREDLHPALVSVLAQAVLRVQSEPTLNANGDSKLFALGIEALSDDPEFPLSSDARREYKSGPTFFNRNFSFWVANLFNRAWILLLPAIGIIVPLMRVVPLLYNWRMRRRILSWYRELKNLENDLPKKADAEFIEQKEQALERIDEGVRRISVPIQFSADIYNLRDHVEFVRRRIEQLRDGGAKSAASPAFADHY